MTDLPDADLNLSYRLQQMTSIKVDPYARIIRANDPELFSYPFLMTAAAGAMVLEEDEIVGLRKYLLNGGFSCSPTSGATGSGTTSRAS
jgi:hypothetical protein